MHAVYSGTIYGNRASSLFNSRNSTVNIINTIFWNGHEREIESWGAEEVNVAYSNVYGEWGNYDVVNWIEGNINSDPMFVDTTNADYRLLEGSPCIDAGIQDTFLVYNGGNDTLFIPAMDYMGSAPDIGAFESDPDNPITNIKNYSTLPSKYNLKQNYPNPFNPSTKIKFDLPKPETVKIEIYNIIGQKIETLLNKSMPAGYHEVTFDGQNLSSGIYLYRIEAGEWQDVKKMVYLK